MQVVFLGGWGDSRNPRTEIDTGQGRRHKGLIEQVVSVGNRSFTAVGSLRDGVGRMPRSYPTQECGSWGTHTPTPASLWLRAILAGPGRAV